MDKLSEFIVQAKQATYASTGVEGDILGEGGSKILAFSDGEWRYQDQYFGFNPFSGEEVVWQNGQAVWSLNYYGRVLAGAPVSALDVYAFLKLALQRVDVLRPFRGPEEFADGIWRYVDESRGSVEAFTGIETIYRSGIEVYELSYHGGIVKPKSRD